MYNINAVIKQSLSQIEFRGFCKVEDLCGFAPPLHPTVFATIHLATSPCKDAC